MKKATSIPGSQAIRPHESRDQGAWQSAPRPQAPARRRYAAAHPGRNRAPSAGGGRESRCHPRASGGQLQSRGQHRNRRIDDAAIDVMVARGEELGFQKGVEAARVAERAARV